ncbi:MAG: tetratricopeptide repeat protein [Planctomycetota bacterium]|nr:tetratricopeptide repeat protein [Planctomycetota bacterium]
MRSIVLVLLGALLWCPVAIAGDAVDEAAGLPAAEALPKLEALLEKALEEKRAKDVLRIRRHLGRLYVADGQPYAALVHLEAAAEAALDDRQDVDRLHYAEALLATARQNIRSQGIGRSVNPFLRDAVAASAKELVVAGKSAEETLRARRHRVRIEAHYLLGELETASAAWEAARQDLSKVSVELHDLLARVRYAQRRWTEAAQAFERAGNDLGAAAAWDAARKPERSVPLYARRIAADPSNAALLAQALRGVRYTGAHGALLEALEGVETPEGDAGVELLLLRADLMEAGGRAADALPLLEDAAKRNELDPRPKLRLARLVVLAGKVEDEAVWDRAADAYVAAIERDPGSTAAAEGLSWIARREYSRLWTAWRDERVTDRCVRVQKALVEAMPDDALAWMNLGNTLRVLGRHEQALEAYARAIEANPYDPAIRSDLGLALGSTGQVDAALQAYEKSLELDSSHVSGRQNAARVLWLKGRDDEAAKHLGAAIRTSRAIGRSTGTYRFLMDRIWRTRQDPRLR